MKQGDIVIPIDTDSITCACGYSNVAAKFDKCDTNGKLVKRSQKWNGLFLCKKCGRIIDSKYLKIDGITFK
jgi:hypothetical protein